MLDVDTRHGWKVCPFFVCLYATAFGGASGVSFAATLTVRGAAAAWSEGCTNFDGIGSIEIYSTTRKGRTPLRRRAILPKSPYLSPTNWNRGHPGTTCASNTYFEETTGPVSTVRSVRASDFANWPPMPNPWTTQYPRERGLSPYSGSPDSSTAPPNL